MANDDKVRILQYDRIYKNFIDPIFIPEGKDEYHLRDEQTTFPKEKWRHLRADEIERLVNNKNVATNWDDILVTDEFDPSMVKRNSFFGLVQPIADYRKGQHQYQHQKMPCRHSSHNAAAGAAGNKFLQRTVFIGH